MPPSGFNGKAVKGLLIFLDACYEDLLKEMQNGKDPNKVVEKELSDIKTYLEKFTIKH